MTNLTLALKNDHKAILAALDAFERALDSGDLPGVFDGLRFFLEDLALHRHREEDILYPELTRRDPAASGMVATMIEDHAHEREHVDDLRRALETGDSGGVMDHGRFVIHLVRDHIEREELVLFPTTRCLPAGVREQMVRRFAVESGPGLPRRHAPRPRAPVCPGRAARRRRHHGGATMTDITAVLRREHEVLFERLAWLEHAAAVGNVGGLQGSLHALREDFARHWTKETDVLLPAMARLMPQEVRSGAVPAEDARFEREHLDALEGALRAEDAARFRAESRTLFDAFQRHIVRSESMILPLAVRGLVGDALERVRREFVRIGCCCRGCSDEAAAPASGGWIKPAGSPGAGILV